jgi:hypothetical protein
VGDAGLEAEVLDHIFSEIDWYSDIDQIMGIDGLGDRNRYREIWAQQSLDACIVRQGRYLECGAGLYNSYFVGDSIDSSDFVE